MKKQLKPRAKKIVNLLKNKFGAKAIILTGSRHVGDYEQDSDWDMFVFTTKLKKGEERIKVHERCGPTRISGETKLDCYWLPADAKFRWENFKLKLRFCEIMYDTKGIAKKVIKDAYKIYDKGPDWSKTKWWGEKQRSWGYLKKMNYLLKKRQHGALFKRICFYYAEYLFGWWFSLRDEWPLRPQQAFDYIKKKDPNFFKLLRRVYGNTTLEQKVKACEKIHNHIFESLKFKKLTK